MKPLVSIIIPTYNRAHLIGETLDSILAQTYTHWECIVVDDGSTDNTDKLMERYCKKESRFKYHHRPKDRPKGANTCRNYGFELCKGEYVNWFDSDDLMLEDFIKDKVLCFEKTTSLVINQGQIVDSNNKIIKQLNLSFEENLFKEYVLKKSEIFTPSVMIKKEFLKGKQLFNHKLKRSQEVDFFSRLFFKLDENDFKLIHKNGFNYRQHSESKTVSDNSYKSDYKYSHFYVHNENWKRAILIGDDSIGRYCNKKILILLVMAIENKDLYLYKLIMKSMKNKISAKSYYKKLVLCRILWLTKAKGYKIKQLLKN